MPSVLHEILVELLRDGPELLVELLADRIEALAISRIRFERDEPNLSQLLEVEADLVLRVLAPDDTLGCALVIEVQLAVDPAKPRVWPLYQAGVFRRLGCPTFLVVIAIDPAVARWAHGPFSNGQMVLRPLVIGPQQVPRVTRPTRARGCVALTLLSGLAHRDDPEIVSIGAALWQALNQGDREREDDHLYWDTWASACSSPPRTAATCAALQISGVALGLSG